MAFGNLCEGRERQPRAEVRRSNQGLRGGNRVAMARRMGGEGRVSFTQRCRLGAPNALIGTHRTNASQIKGFLPLRVDPWGLNYTQSCSRVRRRLGGTGKHPARAVPCESVSSWELVTLGVGSSPGKGFPRRPGKPGGKLSRRRPNHRLLRRGLPCAGIRGVKSRAEASWSLRQGGARDSPCFCVIDL